MSWFSSRTRLVTIINVGIVVFFMTMTLGYPQDQLPMIDKDSKPGINTVPFAYVSKVQGMIGGHSTTMVSEYVTHSGFVQVSKEDTNGFLYFLRQGPSGGQKHSKPLFDNLAFPPSKKAIPDEDKPLILSEFYPPITVIGYLRPNQQYTLDSYEKGELSEPITGFVNKISSITSHAKLFQAETGVYMRAQRLLGIDPAFIKPDIFLNSRELLEEDLLLKVLSQEMALVYVGQESEKIEIGGHSIDMSMPSLFIQVEGHFYYRIIILRYKG